MSNHNCAEHPDPQVLDLAHAALTRAIDGEPEQAVTCVHTLYTAHGWSAVAVAMMYWCDALVEHMCDGPRNGRRARGLFLADADNGEMISSDDQRMPPRAQWAAKLIEARVTMDRDRAMRLLDELPDDGYEAGEHVMTVLDMIAGTMTSLPRGIGLCEDDFLAAMASELPDDAPTLRRGAANRRQYARDEDAR